MKSNKRKNRLNRVSGGGDGSSFMDSINGIAKLIGGSKGSKTPSAGGGGIPGVTQTATSTATGPTINVMGGGSGIDFSAPFKTTIN